MLRRGYQYRFKIVILGWAGWHGTVLARGTVDKTSIAFRSAQHPSGIFTPTHSRGFIA